MLGLVGIIVRKRKHVKGELPMKHIKTLLVVFMLLPVLAGTASAAELRVLKIGPGDGFVEGEDIWCGRECRATYEEGTLVQLKATALAGSRFIGWEVNGQPHEGALQIEGDALVKAIFESDTPLDELTALYYAGGVPYRKTAVLNEMVVFFDYHYEDQIPYEPEAFRTYVHDLMQHAHPEATLIHYGKSFMLLRWPEPFPKAYLEDLLVSVRQFEYVDEADWCFTATRSIGGGGTFLHLYTLNIPPTTLRSKSRQSKWNTA